MPQSKILRKSGLTLSKKSNKLIRGTNKLKVPQVNNAKLIKRHLEYFVYIVESVKGTFYTGYTKNLENRIKLHNSGHGAKYLRGKTPIKLVYQKRFKYYKVALKNERKIKRYPRRKKEQLVTEYFRRSERNTPNSEI